MGYSKAADMWSVGCIVFLLLSGTAAFYPRDVSDARHNEAVLDLSSKCDLGMMERHPAWHSVGKRPKNLVRGLLELDEDKRLDVTEALAHSWFTNPSCAKEFEAVYQHCIRDWKPRRKKFDFRLIEELNWPNATTALALPTRSQHFVQLSGADSPDAFASLSQKSKRPLTTMSTIAEEDADLSPHGGTPSRPRVAATPSQPDVLVEDLSQLAIDPAASQMEIEDKLPLDQANPQRPEASSIAFSEHSRPMSGYGYFSYLMDDEEGERMVVDDVGAGGGVDEGEQVDRVTETPLE